MRSRRSISDIVAVVLLIVIAIAAAVIIYMWLSGLIGSVHTSTSATQVKLEITGASVTPASSGSSYNVIASVYNPPGSPTVSIATAELEFTNGTLICSTPLTTVTITTPLLLVVVLLLLLVLLLYHPVPLLMLLSPVALQVRQLCRQGRL